MYSWTFNTRHLQRNLKKCSTNWKQRMFAFKIKVFPLTIATFKSLCFWFVPYFSQSHTVSSRVGVFYANCQGLQQFTIEQPKQLQGGFRCSTVYLFATNFKIMIPATILQLVADYATFLRCQRLPARLQDIQYILETCFGGNFYPLNWIEIACLLL